jgi:hypothetical protein
VLIIHFPIKQRDLEREIYEYANLNALQPNALKEVYNNINQLVFILGNLIDDKREIEVIKSYDRILCIILSLF